VSAAIHRRNLGYESMNCQSMLVRADAVSQLTIVRVSSTGTSIASFILYLIIRTIKLPHSMRLYSGLAIRESLDPSTKTKDCAPIPVSPTRKDTTLYRLERRLWAIWQSFTLSTLPMPRIHLFRSKLVERCRRGYFSLSIGQTLLVLAYIGAVIACSVIGAQLTLNANRPGMSLNLRLEFI